MDNDEELERLKAENRAKWTELSARIPTPEELTEEQRVAIKELTGGTRAHFVHHRPTPPAHTSPDSE